MFAAKPFFEPNLKSLDMDTLVRGGGLVCEGEAHKFITNYEYYGENK